MAFKIVQKQFTFPQSVQTESITLTSTQNNKRKNIQRKCLLIAFDGVNQLIFVFLVLPDPMDVTSSRPVVLHNPGTPCANVVVI